MDRVLEVIKGNKFAMKKKFGQNFITDGNLLSAIVEDAGIDNTDLVVEVGAGAGTLTYALAKRAKSVLAFEIDTSLEPVLKETMLGCDNVKLVFSDVLKVKAEELGKMTGGKFKVVANLPYYITSPVLFYFFESGLPIESITVMVQKEVALRMIASPNTPDYGVLSLAVQSRGKAEITRHVSRKMFTPEPNVDSAVVKITMGRDVENRAELDRLFRCAFAMRRKTLVNNLMASYGMTRQCAEEILTSLGIDVRVRGEVLNLEQFEQMAKILKNKNY